MYTRDLDGSKRSEMGVPLINSVSRYINASRRSEQAHKNLEYDSPRRRRSTAARVYLWI